MKLKVDLHIHYSGDPQDFLIRYSAKDLIDVVEKKGLDILAITSHNKIFNEKKAMTYAKEKGILLLSGIEKSVEGKDVLIINPDESAEDIETFEDLKRYRKNHPRSLIIAPHPFFPVDYCLGNELIKYHDLFDAYELSYFYTKHIDYNKDMKKYAKKHKKKIVANSDLHHLHNFGKYYTEIECEKNYDSLLKAIRNKDVKNTFPVSRPLTYLEFIREIYLSLKYMFLGFLLKKPSDQS